MPKKKGYVKPTSHNCPGTDGVKRKVEVGERIVVMPSGARHWKNKLTKEKIKEFCDQVQLGIGVYRSARLVGLSPHTVKLWQMLADAEGNGVWMNGKWYKKRALHVYFKKEVQKAIARGEKIALRNVRRAILGGKKIKQRITVKPDGTKIHDEFFERPSLKAATWFLERRFRKRWGGGDRDRVEIEVGGKKDNPIRVEMQAKMEQLLMQADLKELLQLKEMYDKLQSKTGGAESSNGELLLIEGEGSSTPIGNGHADGAPTKGIGGKTPRGKKSP